MEERLRRTALWTLRVWLAIGAGVLLAGTWYVVREPLAIVVPPLGLAVVVVYVLDPFVRMLARRGVPRAVSTGLAYVVLLGVVVAGSIVLVPVVSDQIGDLAEEAPEIAVDLERAINRQLERLDVEQRVVLDPESEEVRDAVRRYLVGGTAQGRFSTLLSSAGDVAREVLHAAIIILLGPVLAFYLLADLPRVLAGLRRLVPPGRRDEVDELTRGIVARVGGYFRGQLLVAAFVGVATAVALLVIGLPFWALVGLVTGVFNLVPLIGPFVGGAIGVVIALTVGDGFTQALWVVVAMTAVQQVDNHVVSPNVMSRTVELHPITVMLGLLVAGTLYGIFGMLVAVPLIAAAKLVALHVLARRAPWAVA